MAETPALGKRKTTRDPPTESWGTFIAKLLRMRSKACSESGSAIMANEFTCFAEAFEDQEAEISRLRSELEKERIPDGWQIVPKDLSREVGDAMIEAMWPSGEVIFADEFDGPEQQLSAGWAAMLASSPPVPEQKD